MDKKMDKINGQKKRTENGQKNGQKKMDKRKKMDKKMDKKKDVCVPGVIYLFFHNICTIRKGKYSLY